MPEDKSFYIAQVVVPIPIDRPLSYSIPAEWNEEIRPGIQVVVPVGNRYEAGIVVDVIPVSAASTIEKDKLKPIADVVSLEPYVYPDVMRLLEWISQYYVCHLGEAYRLIQPASNLEKSRLEIRRLNAGLPERLTAVQKEILAVLDTESWFPVEAVENMLSRTNLFYHIQKLKRSGLIETRYRVPRQRRIRKIEKRYTLRTESEWPESIREKYQDRSSKKYQATFRLLDFLRGKEPLSIRQFQDAGFSPALVRRLAAEGVLSIQEVEVPREQSVIFQEEGTEIRLTDEQQRFIEMVRPYLIENPDYQPFLLHGITGSGKTQIYIELIRLTLETGRQAIVLIPEIVLTPQTMARFYRVFGDRVAVLHSRLSRGERLEVLQRIREGQFQVVLGPRSVIFAPFPRLGLIVVDEEHESSYKQTDATPRYHARDVALYRAYLNRIPIVLGSATPSFESLHNARMGNYQYFHLSQRIHERNLPRTVLIDLRNEWRRMESPPILSESLKLKIEARLISREQIMLLQNRRGFAPYIQCQECGFVARCPNCDITLTFHVSDRRMRCHYCGHEEVAPDFCPNCQGIDLLYRGVGTQKIEQEVLTVFPHARTLRMDQDTTGGKYGHARLLEKFRNGEADILIGTKMIAKGLDFQRVTLVGIISADQGLNFPDFRSSEKVFQLLVQAAGRAGRGAAGGEVVIQTYDPQHYIFQFLSMHDYLKFYEREIETRKTLNYPPFSRLVLIRLVGEREDLVRAYGKVIASFLTEHKKNRRYVVLGPAPAPLVKINNRFRYQILIKQPREEDPSMHYVRHLIRESIYKNPDVRKWPVEVQIDVDPVEIL
ncbi:MAG: primosomal protein N' [Calditrichaeota bacterium]|nr:primosomal protein N' [Calditrichota bacterium]